MRRHGIIDALTEADVKCWADKAYRGAGRPVRVPFRGLRCSTNRITDIVKAVVVLRHAST